MTIKDVFLDRAPFLGETPLRSAYAGQLATAGTSVILAALH